MVNRLLAAAAEPAEAQGGGEDWPAPLTCLHGPSDKAPSIAHPLNMIENGNFRVAGKDKVAVHAVNSEVGGDGAHRS